MNAREQAAAAIRGEAAAALPGWCVFRCEGADTLDLFNRLSSADLAPLRDGRAATTLFLSPTGRVMFRVRLAPFASGSLLAVTEPGCEASFPAWIDTYTFAEDCRVAHDPTRAVAAWFGSAAPGREAPEWIRADWPELMVALHVGARDEVERRLAGARAMDGAGLLQLRVLHGEPAMGRELDERRFPLEAGLLREISFTKGCYTGQEVVARQDTYGKVTRRLVGLAFDEAPADGETLAGEKDGCEITSVAPEPVPIDGRERHLALGYVGTKSAAPGTSVATASGREGVVVALPPR